MTDYALLLSTLDNCSPPHTKGSMAEIMQPYDASSLARPLPADGTAKLLDLETGLFDRLIDVNPNGYTTGVCAAA